MARADTAIDRAARAARQALKTAIGEDYDRLRFRIERFGVHRDGYMHARIIVDGAQKVYLHCRFGSWLAPVHVNGHPLLKEPEALLGSDLGRTVKLALAHEARRFHPHRQRGAR